MLDCDLFVAILPPDGKGSLLRNDGTFTALGWVSTVNKPVIIIAGDPGRNKGSDLFHGMVENDVASRVNIETFWTTSSLLIGKVTAMLTGHAVQAANQRQPAEVQGEF